MKYSITNYTYSISANYPVADADSATVPFEHPGVLLYVVSRSVGFSVGHSFVGLSAESRHDLQAFFVWENAKDLSKFASMTSVPVTAELKGSNYLTKWVD